MKTTIGAIKRLLREALADSGRFSDEELDNLPQNWVSLSTMDPAAAASFPAV